MSEPLLQIADLVVTFGATDEPAARAVDGVTLDLAPGEALGLVGESGSGKSLTALSVIGLLPPNARVRGAVRFGGRELLELPGERLRELRGAEIGMVFQEPMTSLNPVLTVGRQLTETVRCHDRGVGKEAARRRAIEVLGQVRLPAAEQRLASYPHQLSGGMRQRVMLAIALCCEPSLLIADEPTTALDVTVQAQILELLAELRGELGLAVLLISHDLSVVARLCQRVVVMYAGQVVEQGPTDRVLSAPSHPYTAALLAARPDPARPGERLAELPAAGDDARRAPGCRFASRCERASAACAASPPLRSADEPAAGAVRCVHPLEWEGER